MPVAPDVTSPEGPTTAIADPEPVPPVKSEWEVRRSPVLDLILMYAGKILEAGFVVVN